MKLEVEETPTIHPSDRWKLNSSRILSLAFCVVAIMRLGGDPDRPLHYPLMKIYVGTMDMSVGNLFFRRKHDVLQ